MESSQGFHNVKIPINKPLTWKLIPNQRQAWQLVDEERLLAKISIPYRPKQPVGSFIGYKFWIEPNHDDLIKLKELGDNAIGAAVDWGILKRGPRRSARLILKNGQLFNLNYWEPKLLPWEFDIILVSSNPGDAGRIIGITHFNANLLPILALLGFTERKTSTFEIKQYHPEDPPIALLASICYYFTRKVHFEKTTL